jgi:hypothetical protein
MINVELPVELTRKKTEVSEETRPSVALSTTNPTWCDRGSSPIHRDKNPATV